MILTTISCSSNAHHSRVKQWIGGFPGVATRYLPSNRSWYHVVNHLPAALKDYFRPFRGSATRYLDGYLAWFIARQQ